MLQPSSWSQSLSTRMQLLKIQFSFLLHVVPCHEDPSMPHTYHTNMICKHQQILICLVFLSLFLEFWQMKRGVLPVLVANWAIWISVISFEWNVCEIISRTICHQQCDRWHLMLIGGQDSSIGGWDSSGGWVCEDEQLGSESRQGCDPPTTGSQKLRCGGTAPMSAPNASHPPTDSRSTLRKRRPNKYPTSAPWPNFSHLFLSWYFYVFAWGLVNWSCYLMLTFAIPSVGTFFTHFWFSLSHKLLVGRGGFVGWWVEENLWESKKNCGGSKILNVGSKDIVGGSTTIWSGGSKMNNLFFGKSLDVSGTLSTFIKGRLIMCYDGLILVSLSSTFGLREATVKKIPFFYEILSQTGGSTGFHISYSEIINFVKPSIFSLI